MSIHTKYNGSISEIEEVYIGDSDNKPKEVDAIYGGVNGKVELLWKRYPKEPWRLANVTKNSTHLKTLDGGGNVTYFVRQSETDTGIPFSIERISPQKVLLPDLQMEVEHLKKHHMVYSFELITNSDGTTLMCMGNNRSDTGALIVWDGINEISTNYGEVFNGNSSSTTWYKTVPCSDDEGNTVFAGGADYDGKEGWANNSCMAIVDKTLAISFLTGSDLAYDVSEGEAVFRTNEMVFIGGVCSRALNVRYINYNIHKYSNGVQSIMLSLKDGGTYRGRIEHKVYLGKDNSIWIIGGRMGRDTTSIEKTKDIDIVDEHGILTTLESGCPDDFHDGDVDGNGNILLGVKGQFQASKTPVYTYRYINGAYVYTLEQAYNENTFYMDSRDYSCITDSAGDVIQRETRSDSSYKNTWINVWPKLKNK